jgi:large subunit ribosomal protein L1
MSKTGKRLKKAKENVDRTASYTLSDAVNIIKKNANTKFDETVDVALNLGVDPKHADQMVRGVVSLPHGTGKSLRVAVFAKGDKVKEAEEAGADLVGSDELADQVKKGEINFDRIIATPDMMAVVGQLGKVLGPKGLMPNPKLGTVTMDVASAVKAVKGGQIEFRVEKSGIVHAGVGKASFSADAIGENISTFINAIIKAKPTGVKGSYMKRVSISSTMGPSVRLDISHLGD